MTPRTARDLAQHLSLNLEGEPDLILKGVASPEQAAQNDLIYLESAKNIQRVIRSASKCVITSPEMRVPGKTVILSERPKLSFAQAAMWLVPEQEPAGVHATAIVAQSAVIGAGVTIGPFAVIEDEVTIGVGSHIGAFSFLGASVRVGEKCRLYPRTTLYPGTRLGNRVIVHSGAVLGADGFGYVTDQGRHWKFPQVGGLEIADDVEIGANTTIDRGSLGTTRIGTQVKLDNLVHVAHNVEIGEGSLIAAQTGIAGSSSLGRGVLLGGQVGIGDHCRLEDGSVVGGQGGILPGKIIRRGQTVWGTPARELGKFKEQYVWAAKLPELARRLEQLEKVSTPAKMSSEL